MTISRDESAASGRSGTIDEDSAFWAKAALGAIAAALALRVGLLALELAPLHFDEAQYWTYGEALDWGYYSKPPMIAWIIRLGVELFGDTPFGVRIGSPVIHSVIAWLVFLTARRLFDARTGFWATACYLTLPGVTVGAALMTTDTPMMAAWALGLYALARIIEPTPPRGEGGAGDARLGWYALFGAAIGMGLLSKYTIIALAGGALGYALLTGAARRSLATHSAATVLSGPVLALLAALLVWSPNLWWNAQNGFASILHVADNAKLGDGPDYDIGKMAEFVAAQFGVFGPILLGLLIFMLWRGGWRREQAYLLLLWTSLPLLIAMIVQSFLSRSHPNWAAPAYLGLSIVVAALALDQGRRFWLKLSAALGIAIFFAFAGLALFVKEHHTALPRIADPFKKLRPGPAVCAKALPFREGRKLFSADRRLLADCMFMGGLGLDEIRILTLGPPGNHYQLVAPLTARDAEPLLLIHAGPRGQIDGVLSFFERVEILDEGSIRLHENRSVDYVIAEVEGVDLPD